MSIKPLYDKIVIKVIDDTQQTSGGIFIPDSEKQEMLFYLLNIQAAMLKLTMKLSKYYPLKMY